MENTKKIENMIDTLKNQRHQDGEEIRKLQSEIKVIQAKISLKGDFIDNLKELNKS